MHIECPHCATSNKIEFAEHIICCKCDKSFKGQSFGKLKKPLISAGAALVIGTVGGVTLDQLMDVNRYPLAVEYAIIDSCLNGSNHSVSISWYQDKREICLCAVQDTIENVPYRDFKSDNSLFLAPFKKAMLDCK